MKISRFLKPFSFLPALILMYMIYSFSAQDAQASTESSLAVSRLVIRVVNRVGNQNWDPWTMEENAQKIQVPVRKAAHMGEYFLLTVAVAFPLYVYGVRGFLLMLLATVICVCYACGDEYHQSFVSGRAPSMRDVGIDSIGVVLGVILTRIFGWTARKAIAEPAEQHAMRSRRRSLDERELELDRRESELRRREKELGGYSGVYGYSGDSRTGPRSGIQTGIRTGSDAPNSDDPEPYEPETIQSTLRQEAASDETKPSHRERREEKRMAREQKKLEREELRRREEEEEQDEEDEEDIRERYIRHYEEEHPADDLSEDMPLSSLLSWRSKKSSQHDRRS